MKKEFSSLVNKIVNRIKAEGTHQLTIENSNFDGKNLIVSSKPYVFWGNCSYMGLETDERIKEASIDAIKSFGTQFSTSRATIQLGLYQEAEQLLSEIFGKPTLLAPTTSLGHIALIPLFMGKGDALIIDQKVHNSVQNGVNLTKCEGSHVEMLNHNRIDLLETRIQILKQRFDKIWYFADGVYSMFGDLAPLKDIKYLLDKYEQFHFYVDDAHGMSWIGKNGSGYVIDEIGWHPRMILTSSLAKGFGSCGGAMVFDNKEQLDLVRNCGSTMIFSGPLQPAILGATIESAKIHLSTQIDEFQLQIKDLIAFFTEYAQKIGLPLVSVDLSPIKYIALGRVTVGNKMSKFLMAQQQYVNHYAFPAVPINNCGLRVCITRHHTKEEIKTLLDMIAEGLFVFLLEENQTLDDVYAAFGLNKET